MSKVISTSKLSETLTLNECSDGWWLYDSTRGMNLSMCAKSSTGAFVEALTYYQKRLSSVEQEHKELTTKVNAFVTQFVKEEED